jgi:hypothetical protein
MLVRRLERLFLAVARTDREDPQMVGDPAVRGRIKVSGTVIRLDSLSTSREIVNNGS